MCSMRKYFWYYVLLVLAIISFLFAVILSVIAFRGGDIYGGMILSIFVFHFVLCFIGQIRILRDIKRFDNEIEYLRKLQTRIKKRNASLYRDLFKFKDKD